MTRDIEVWLADNTLGPDAQVGTLTRAAGRGAEVVRFEYARSWIEAKQAFAIDPELALTPGPHFVAAGRVLNGIFRDTAPDRWGRVLMERREAALARASARPVRRLTDWDFLIGVNDAYRMGALRFRDAERQAWLDDQVLAAPPAARLRELEAVVRQIDEPGSEQRPEYAAWLQLLVAPGTSLGGARPKATFEDESGQLWLAKFPANADRRDVGVWEFLAHRLAQDAGLRVPAAQCLRFASQHHTFCVQRFDRLRGTRRLYASAMTLLGHQDGDSGSYLEIAQAIEQQGDPGSIEADLHEVYARVVFSILVGNRDDHFRNHGFLRSAKGWSLSPAFDLNPSPDRHEHVLAIDEHSATPDTAMLGRTAKYYRLSADAAAAIEQRVRGAVAGWEKRAGEIGIRPQEVALLRGVIDATR